MNKHDNIKVKHWQKIYSELIKIKHVYYEIPWGGFLTISNFNRKSYKFNSCKTSAATNRKKKYEMNFFCVPRIEYWLLVAVCPGVWGGGFYNENPWKSTKSNYL